MKALITGATSGIGLSMAKYLEKQNVDLILVGRNKEKLERIASSFKVETKLVVLDLNDLKSVKELYVLTKDDDVDILINNAGFGLFGEFAETDIKTELSMIDVNIKAVHLLTKLFLKDMVKKNSGYILNVASAAGFGPGPLMATYYATKSYVLNLTEAINYELKKKNSKVQVSVLCPGPVATNFNNVAGVKFASRPLTSEYVGKYAIDKMFKGKTVIIPGLSIKLITFLRRLFPRKLILNITYNYQRRK